MRSAYQLYLAMMKVEKRSESGGKQSDDTKVENGEKVDVEEGGDAKVEHRVNQPKVERRKEVKGEQPAAPKAEQSDRSASKQPESKKSKDTPKLCKQFKKTLSHRDVTVHFVGVW